MILFLTSSPAGTYRSEEPPQFKGFNPANGMVAELRRRWPENARCLLISAFPEEHALNDRMRSDFEGILADTRLPFSCMDICDSRNGNEIAAALHTYDFIILGGGHVPTENAFFHEIGLPGSFRGYQGIVMGISAGTMNCARIVYAQPEMPGEAADPSYERFIPGLGLTEYNILPHYNAVKDDVIDGMRLFEDVTFADSFGHTFYVLTDGSYLFQENENENENAAAEIRGEAYRIRDGEITQICREGEKFAMGTVPAIGDSPHSQGLSPLSGTVPTQKPTQNTPPFDLDAYLTKGVEDIVKDVLRATLKDPKESIFIARFAAASAKAARLRSANEKKGLHVPSYLIASITSRCNLHCAGCYSRCAHATTDDAPVSQLTAEEWAAIFRDAKTLGISFILLAGGEPLLRRDVVEKAAEIPEIIFPIFTNGTFLDSRYFRLFDRARNLIPVLSIEGNENATDSRRGRGIYKILMKNMTALKEQGILFGASVTVTTENVDEVTSDSFLDTLQEKGCRLVIFVEYVPVTDESRELAPGDEARAFLNERIENLRKTREDMLFISFPGDEKSSGGCLAAGRGFFHINSHGGAEPCPFSPYSDCNVRDVSLEGALRSPLFTALRDGGLLLDDHIGGCILNEKRAEVEDLLRGCSPR